MSVEATWDLRTNACPRSLCVYAAPHDRSSSKKDSGIAPPPPPPPPPPALQESTSSLSITQHSAIAVLYGTEVGSIHYRTFPPPRLSFVRAGGLSSTASGTAGTSSTSSSSHQHQPLAPLGLSSSTSSSTSSQTTIPRAYYPMDLQDSALPHGSVIVSIQALASTTTNTTTSTTSNNTPSVSIFLLLVDDNRGTSASQPGAYAAYLASSLQGSLHILTKLQHPSLDGIGTLSHLPRMSCSTYHPATGIVYGAGRTLSSIAPEVWESLDETALTNNHPSVVGRISGHLYHSQGHHHHHPNTSRHPFRPSSHRHRKRIVFSKMLIPAPGVRSGQGGVALTAKGKVAVVVVGSAFYAVAGTELDDTLANDSPGSNTGGGGGDDSSDWTKILSFAQSSQVHPVIMFDIEDESLDADWSCMFLANGRECAIVDVFYGPPSAPIISASKPRNGSVTVASPILAAVSSWPWVALLTSDGLISVRSPSCLAISLRTVEVGTQPNDYFILRTLHDETQAAPWIVAASYSGEGKVLQCQPDTAQDLADRLMRHSIDAFGANGFPRAELAEAVQASFTATSYVGPEPSPHARVLLRQYLEAVLGLTDWESGGTSGWPTELSSGDGHHGTFAGAHSLGATFSGRGAPPTVVSSATPSALLTGTSLLCLVCLQLQPPASSLANRAAKAAAEKMGVVIGSQKTVSAPTMSVCELVAEKLLREASSMFSLIGGSSPTPIARGHRTSQSTMYTDFVEASIWLLRACGKHERAIDTAYERLQRQHVGQQADTASNARGAWSQLKYESYTATHLCELWASGSDEGCRLVIHSAATSRLLENNPRLGLSVFTSSHPQNESQWQALRLRDDPLAHPEHTKAVVKLLKSVNPAVPYNAEPPAPASDHALPLDSGRALAVAFLESAIGISSGRPIDEDEYKTHGHDPEVEERVAAFHDELSFLLLEGIISERRDDATGDNDTALGAIYRSKLRNLLRWPMAKIRADQFMNALPKTFLQEKALVLGRLGRHEAALRILYRDLGSLDLALEYCDNRHEQMKTRLHRRRARQHQLQGRQLDASPIEEEEDRLLLEDAMKEEDNAYLPLIRVALESDDTERGTAAAIQVLALRRSAIDRAAALRLLPSNVPVSAVARPFLIPALVDSESQVRRLTVVSALLRARYLRLKSQLIEAQLKAQSNLHVVPQLRNLNLGNPLHSSKAFRARTSMAPSSGAGTSASSSSAAWSGGSAMSAMPDVLIVKHFFPRHLVIQAKVTNSLGPGGMGKGTAAGPGRTLSDISFVVAESSEEDAIQPLLQVPIQILPAGLTGCAWTVLSASPARMDGPTAQLTCELRYTVHQSTSSTVIDSSGVGLIGDPSGGHTFVEELQDLDVHSAHFS